MINNYKKFMLLILASCQLSPVLKAGFLNIDKNKIESTRLDLIKSEFNRKLITTGASCALALGAGAFVWRCFMPSTCATDKDFSAILNNLSEDEKNQFKEQLKNMLAKENQENTEDNPKTYKERIISAAKYLKIGIPFVAFEIVKTLASNKAIEFLNYFTPSGIKWSDKLFSHRTISWFLTHRTSLFDVIVALNNDMDEIEENNIDEILQKSIESNYNMLICQVEKIIGFMVYTTNLLPKDNKENKAIKNRSLIIQRRIIANIMQILSLIKKLDYATENQDLNNSKNTEQNIELREEIKKKLIVFTNNIESFKLIDKSLDFEDDIDRNIFEAIKSVLTYKPKQGFDMSGISEEEMLRQMADLGNILQNMPSADIVAD